MPRAFLPLIVMTSCALAGPGQDDPVEIRTHDIHLLTREVTESPWIQTGLDYAGLGRNGVARAESATWLLHGDDLATLVKDQFPGAVWDSPGIRMSHEDGTLILSAPRSLQARVDSFLTALRAALERTIALEAVVLLIDPVRLDELRPAEHPQSLTPEQARGILQAGTVLKSGRARAVPGRRISLQDAVSETYVRDYDAQISTGAGDLDPVTSTFTVGAGVDLRPYVDPGTDSIILDVRGFVSEKEGIDEKKLRLQKDIEVMEGDKENLPRRKATRHLLSEVTVHQPRISLQTVRTTLRVRERETAIVAAVKRPDAVLLFLVTPTLLPASGPAADPKAPRILDLRGFRETPKDSEAPVPDLPAEPPADFALNEPRDRSLHALLESLRTDVAAKKGGDLVLVHENYLVEPLLPESRAEVGKFLAAARTPGVRCEGVLIGFRKGAKTDWEHALDPAKGVEPDVMTKLLQEAAKGGRVHILESAELGALSDQRVHVARLQERTYVADYAPQVSTLVSIFDPIIGILRTGFVFEVRPRAGTPLRLEVHASVSEGTLKETPELATGVGLIQLPATRGLRWNAEVVCAADRWTLVGVDSRGRGEAQEDVALFVRARQNVLK